MTFRQKVDDVVMVRRDNNPNRFPGKVGKVMAVINGWLYVSMYHDGLIRTFRHSEVVKFKEPGTAGPALDATSAS